MSPLPPCPVRQPIHPGPPATTARGGFTLIELLVVLSVMSVLLTCVGITLHTLARVNAELRSDLPDTQALTRFSLTLRSDAHDATQWTLEQPEPARQVLRLTRGIEVAAVYESARHTVVREQYRGGERVSREVFRFAPGSLCRWSISPPPSKVLKLLVDQPRGPVARAPETRHGFQITAALGLYGEKP